MLIIKRVGIASFEKLKPHTTAEDEIYAHVLINNKSVEGIGYNIYYSDEKKKILVCIIKYIIFSRALTSGSSPPNNTHILRPSLTEIIRTTFLLLLYYHLSSTLRIYSSTYPSIMATDRVHSI